VLDLDNTLLHATEYRLSQEQSKLQCFRKYGIKLVDPLLSIYHIWQHPGHTGGFSYLIKLRPFCKEFLMHAMVDYDIHFYTAATRRYGEFILELLKHEVTRHDAGTTEDKAHVKAKHKKIEACLTRNRLITRDDKDRFSQGDITKSEAELENLRRAERIVLNQTNGATGANIQQAIENEFLKLNFCRKTLDALAGGDDTLFVILDDRSDVWQTEKKSNLLSNADLPPEWEVSQNLFKIPAYFYYESPHVREYSECQWFEKVLR